MENWLLRTEALVGEEFVRYLRDLRVMICGLGGVGGMALEALARSGVGHFVVVDCDVFHFTNLNRQILALRQTIGRSKVEIAKERVWAINPDAQIIALSVFVDGSFRAVLDEYPVDFVIDAIDSLYPKVQLIHFLWQSKRPFVSAMGTGGRLDASSFRIGVLSDVRGCPLGRKVRQRLRRLDVPSEEIPVVYSLEMVEQGKGVMYDGSETRYYDRGRVRLPRGSLATTVMTSGLLCAQAVFQWMLTKKHKIYTTSNLAKDGHRRTYLP